MVRAHKGVHVYVDEAVILAVLKERILIQEFKISRYVDCLERNDPNLSIMLLPHEHHTCLKGFSKC